jgi:hypothetical protein
VYGKVVCLSCSAEVYQTISTKQVGALWVKRKKRKI